MKESDESYSITVSEGSDSILVKASQYVGAVRALSTVAQMVRKSQGGLYSVGGLPLVIEDAPRYAYRGFMLDTSRHYFSVDFIKSLMDTLSLAKFSVFHWHIVDDESFPLILHSNPSIAENGAYSKDEVYTNQNVLDIVAYGQKLGLRVVPEFDNPGHTRAIGFDPNFADIIRCFNKDWPYPVPDSYRIRGGPPTGVMDPSSEKTF